MECVECVGDEPAYFVLATHDARRTSCIHVSKLLKRSSTRSRAEKRVGHASAHPSMTAAGAPFPRNGPRVYPQIVLGIALRA